MPIDVDELEKSKDLEWVVLNYLAENREKGFSSSELAKKLKVRITMLIVPLNRLELSDFIKKTYYMGDYYYYYIATQDKYVKYLRKKTEKGLI